MCILWLKTLTYKLASCYCNADKNYSYKPHLLKWCDKFLTALDTTETQIDITVMKSRNFFFKLYNLRPCRSRTSRWWLTFDIAFIIYTIAFYYWSCCVCRVKLCKWVYIEIFLRINHVIGALLYCIDPILYVHCILCTPVLLCTLCILRGEFKIVLTAIEWRSS